MKKKSLRYAVLVVVILLGMGFSLIPSAQAQTGTPSVSPQTTPSPSAPASMPLPKEEPTETGAEQVKETGYQVVLPPDWTRTDDIPLGLDVGFRKAQPQGEYATLFFHHEVMPPESGEPPSDTSDMEAQWDSMVQNQYPDARSVDGEIPKVNGRIVVNGTYELTDNGAKVLRRYTYFLSERTAFVVQCTAPPIHWTSVLNDFDAMLATLEPGSATPQRETKSDDLAKTELKRDLPTLLRSFPSSWACSLADVQIITGSGQVTRTLEAKLAFERSDIKDIYRATELLFDMMKAEGTDADLNSIPSDLRGAASKSSEFINYVGQVWGFAWGYGANCDPPIETYKVSILDSHAQKIGSVSISGENGAAILSLSGTVTDSDAKRVVGMYVFE